MSVKRRLVSIFGRELYTKHSAGVQQLMLQQSVGRLQPPPLVPPAVRVRSASRRSLASAASASSAASWGDNDDGDIEADFAELADADVDSNEPRRRRASRWEACVRGVECTASRASASADDAACGMRHALPPLPLGNWTVELDGSCAVTVPSLLPAGHGARNTPLALSAEGLAAWLAGRTRVVLECGRH